MVMQKNKMWISKDESQGCQDCSGSISKSTPSSGMWAERRWKRKEKGVVIVSGLPQHPIQPLCVMLALLAHVHADQALKKTVSSYIIKNIFLTRKHLQREKNDSDTHWHMHWHWVHCVCFFACVTVRNLSSTDLHTLCNCNMFKLVCVFWRNWL